MLINLGTPDAPTPAAVRQYLKQFLSDSRVVEIPRALWWCILHGLILPIRSRASAHKYASIWLSEAGKSGSPLMVYTERQAHALAGQFASQGREITVACAMRYGNPSIPAILEALRAQGVERILLLPLYPQYSGTTTATAFDAVFREMASMRSQPEIRTVKHFHDHPAYIEALRWQVAHYWQQHGRPDFSRGERLLLSFHGVPRRTLELGDPYHCECLKTGRLLGEALGLAAGEYQVTFQSRFGRAEWLQPYTAPTLVELGRVGTTRVDVFCPGFPADCLETLEEIAMEGHNAFKLAGGGHFHHIPCVNDAPVFIDALNAIASQHLQGWPQTAADGTTLEANRARAINKGAAH